MSLQRREDSELPEKSIWSDKGTDPAADARWLASLQSSTRHYRLYERESPYMCPQPDEAGLQESGNLFGVVEIDGENIQQSRGGLLLPSPSMLGHLDALRGARAEWESAVAEQRDPTAPLKSYGLIGGCLDAYQFDPRMGYLLDGIRIRQARMEWQSVRSLSLVKRCLECKRILPMRHATHCLKCDAWFSTTFDAT